MFSLVYCAYKYSQSYSKNKYDLIPQGVVGCSLMSLDVFVILSYLYSNMSITGGEYKTSIFVLALLYMIFSYTVFSLNHKQNSQKKELQKLRRFKISTEPIMAENRAYISNLEKEIAHLRDGKIIKEAPDIIVTENTELRNQLSAIRKEKLELEEEIENLEEMLKRKKSDDADEDLYSENLELKEEIKELAKENERLSKKRQSGRRPDWMSYIPYAEGDDLNAVKKAYRALAKGLHPDVSLEDDEKMKLINTAWSQAQDWLNSRDN